MNGPEQASADEPVYRFRPRLMGTEVWVALTPGALQWQRGDRTIEIPYREIVRVRLGLRPAGLAGRRSIAEIWSRQGLRIEIPSSSVRALLDTHDHGPAFRRFMIELHGRLAAAGAPCRWEAGIPAWRWWPMAAIGATTAAGLVYIVLRTLFGGEFMSAMVIAAFGALFAWQMGPLLKRNRPRLYSPDAIPDDVLPAA